MDTNDKEKEKMRQFLTSVNVHLDDEVFGVIMSLLKENVSPDAIIASLKIIKPYCGQMKKFRIKDPLNKQGTV